MENTYTVNNCATQLRTFNKDSGIIFVSNPSNITMTPSSGLTIVNTWSVVGNIQALDQLSDDIGVTHEVVIGEIVDNLIDE